MKTAAIIVITAVCIALAVPTLAAVEVGGCTLSGLWYTDSGYQRGWGYIPCPWQTRTEADPQDLLYADASWVDGIPQMRFGVNQPFYVWDPQGELYEGIRIEFVGTQIFQFKIDIGTVGGVPWSGAKNFFLEIWGGGYEPTTLYWHTNGPWDGTTRHYEFSVPGIWCCEFRLSRGNKIPVLPEPNTATSIGLLTAFLGCAHVRGRRRS
jgi:hypothetical protein